MNFLELAKKRYSVRAYQSKPVEKEKVDLILQAGRVAPTAANMQPNKFLVLNNEQSLSKLTKGTNPHGAPLAIIVCADKKAAWVRPYDNASMVEIDATIAADHIMMQACSLYRVLEGKLLMKNLPLFPSVLLKKLIITALVGPVFLVFGTVYYLYAADRVLLSISIIVAAACLIRTANLFAVIKRKDYCELNGVCISIAVKRFSKFKKIRLLDDNLVEIELLLKKDTKIIIGYRYKFYLRKGIGSSLPLENEYIVSLLSENNLLGYENLGEA